MKSKRGEVTWNELIPWIVVAVALILILVGMNADKIKALSLVQRITEMPRYFG